MSDLPPDDRSISPVAGGLGLLKSKRMRVLAWGASGLALAGFVVMGARAVMIEPSIQTKPEDTGAASIAQAVPNPPVPPVAQPAPPPPPVLYDQPRQLVFVDAPKSAVAQPVVTQATVNYVRFPTTGGEEFFDVPVTKPSANDRTADVAPGRSDPASAGTNVAFKSRDIAGGKAGKAIRLTYVMMPQHIPCALDVSMDSTLPGAITCHTTQDVLSPDHVLLMATGTEINGTYDAGVKTGQQRLFAFAGSAITKEGIPVPLDSGIADGLGRSGIPGDVDNHTWQRLGAAIMLTGFESTMGVLQSEVSKQGQTSLNLNTGSGVGSIAGQILQHDINIPPTITVPVGTIISIVVDHPISFEDAIKVTTR